MELRVVHLTPGIKATLKSARNRAWIVAASLMRRTLTRTTFVGVTGSAGKTTAKELLVGILSRHMQGHGTLATANYPLHVAKLVCATKRTDRFCVAELGLLGPGDLDDVLRIVRPRIGVVTSIGCDHVGAFGSLEAIAEEKGKLVAALPVDGTAILNADDPLVMAMRARSVARVITYGRTSGADLVASAIDATWPECLHLDVECGGVRAHVRTQLCGEHWVSPVLAAIAASMALGVALEAAAEGVAACAPMRGRMQPHRTKGGIDIVRDDWKAPLWTCDAALEFMRQAVALRKIVVFGTVSDITGDASKQYARLARRALAVADHVVFVGQWASRVLGVTPPDGGKSIRAFGSVRQATGYLRSLARNGDLMLLKGTNRKDHLERIVFAFDEAIQCWQDDCGRESFCVGCRYLYVPSSSARGADLSGAEADVGTGSRWMLQRGDAATSPQYVVGLGNPGERYRDTPHNVGHAVLNQLAESRQLRWERTGDAWIVRTVPPDPGLYLVKLDAHVNRCGAVLRSLFAERRWNPANCILVHDDLDLPLGKVKVRMRGSAGGHRGVASILDAFQTDAIRRVKVGVGGPGTGAAASGFVLQPFSGDDLGIVRKAQAEAVERVLSLAGAGRPAGTSAIPPAPVVH